MEQTVFDVLGWAGLALCIAAFFVKDVIRLRIITVMGCFMMFVYYLHLDVPQGIISNAAVLAVNLFYVARSLDWKAVGRGEKTLRQHTDPA